MSDNKDMRETVLYKLSRGAGLHLFTNVALVSSHQDHYAPFESSRAEVSEAVAKSFLGDVYAEMCEAMLGQVEPSALFRFDVDFQMNEQSLDTLIGRRAHILFLESHAFMRMFTHRFSHFFH
mmetsp:Transcript_32114/g.73733  ORF Transcript_32114/g.73733 Transcript_32114/m.73733 type:complete len:122 (+) Transcript_32114:154-519(+)